MSHEAPHRIKQGTRRNTGFGLEKPVSAYTKAATAKNHYNFSANGRARLSFEAPKVQADNKSTLRDKLKNAGLTALAIAAAIGVVAIANKNHDEGFTQEELSEMPHADMVVHQGQGADALILQTQPDILDGTHPNTRIAVEEYVGDQLASGASAEVPLVPGIPVEKGINPEEELVKNG